MVVQKKSLGRAQREHGAADASRQPDFWVYLRGVRFKVLNWSQNSGRCDVTNCQCDAAGAVIVTGSALAWALLKSNACT